MRKALSEAKIAGGLGVAQTLAGATAALSCKGQYDREIADRESAAARSPFRTVTTKVGEIKVVADGPWRRVDVRQPQTQADCQEDQDGVRIVVKQTSEQPAQSETKRVSQLTKIGLGVVVIVAYFVALNLWGQDTTSFVHISVVMCGVFGPVVEWWWTGHNDQPLR